MNNFIVPIDFSETSKNAARYAAHISTRVPDAHLVLFNVFSTIEAGSDGTPLESDDADRKSLMELALKSVKSELSNIADTSISCVVIESNNFVDSLEKYVENNPVQAIVMGITGSGLFGQILMGSNTLKVVARNMAPVIIVPPRCTVEIGEERNADYRFPRYRRNDSYRIP